MRSAMIVTIVLIFFFCFCALTLLCRLPLTSCTEQRPRLMTHHWCHYGRGLVHEKTLRFQDFRNKPQPEPCWSERQCSSCHTHTHTHTPAHLDCVNLQSLIKNNQVKVSESSQTMVTLKAGGSNEKKKRKRTKEISLHK